MEVFMLKKKYQKIITLIFTISITCMFMSGCGNTSTNYKGSSFENIIGNQIEEMEALKNATELAKTGEIEVAPNASAAAAEAFGEKNENKENNSATSETSEDGDDFNIIDQLIESENTPGKRILPEEVINMANYAEPDVGSWTLAYEDKSEFLNYDYDLDFYTNEGANIGCIIYSRQFLGNEDVVYKDYTNYLAKIEANFKPGYGKSYNSIYNKISDMGDEPYVTFYNIEDKNIFVESLGIYDAENNGIIHFLIFLDESYPHHIDGEYGWALTPIQLIIESGETDIANEVDILFDVKANGTRTYSYQDFQVSDEIKQDLAIRYGY